MSSNVLLMLILTGNQQYSERRARFLPHSQLERLHASCSLAFLCKWNMIDVVLAKAAGSCLFRLHSEFIVVLHWKYCLLFSIPLFSLFLFISDPVFELIHGSSRGANQSNALRVSVVWLQNSTCNRDTEDFWISLLNCREGDQHFWSNLPVLQHVCKTVYIYSDKNKKHTHF